MKWTTFEAVARALGVAIRGERERLDLSQEHVAHEAGISVRHYAKIEKGTENVTIKSLVEIGRVLGMDFAQLVACAADSKVSRKR